MPVYGYIRKSYPKETSIQIKNLMKYNCQDLYIDKKDFIFDEEQQLLLKSLKKADVLIVNSLTVFGKRSNELQQIIYMMSLNNIRLISIDEKIDTSKKYSFNQILTIISMIDKKISGDKIKIKLEEVKDSGRTLGRPTISEDTIKKIKVLRFEKCLNIREIAKNCNVSIGTVYKYIQ